jgi:uncharacterized protein
MGRPFRWGKRVSFRIDHGVMRRGANKIVGDFARDMEFDSFTVVLLVAGPNAEKIDRRELDALQDAHMDHLATMHETGVLQAAGPVADAPGTSLRGLSIHRLPAQEVRALYDRDPSVKAGRLTPMIFTWMVPKGAISFSSTRFPHSQAEL